MYILQLLRAINILEFEYLYKNSQIDMHWHMKNPLLHIKYSKQVIFLFYFLLKVLMVIFLILG